jgi:hypothetical protein
MNCDGNGLARPAWKQPLFLMLIGLLMTGCSTPPPEPSVNLIQPDVVAGAVPDSWTPFSVPPDKYRTSATTKGHAGEPGIEIGGDGERGGVLLNTLPVRKGKSYAMEGWVEVTGAESATATIKLDWLKKNGESITACSGHITPADRGWQRVALHTAPAGTADETPSLRMVLLLAGQGTARFSGLDLREIAPPGGASSGNLLLNGSMESIEGPRVSGWQLTHSKKTRVTMAASDERPHAGRLCLQLKGGGEWAVATSPKFKVVPGKQYTLRGFGRRTVGKALLKLDLYRDKELQRSESSTSVVLNEWEPLQVTLTPVQLEGIEQVAVGIVVRGKEMEAWFDDLTLQVADP